MTSVLDAPPLVGDQQPRVSSVPDAVGSSGEEAIALAASAGLHLDPWQQTVLRQALGERPDGQWAARDVGLIVPRQNGKGAVLEALELAALFLFGERLVLHTAHEMKTAKNHYERMQALIRGAPFLDAQVKQWRNSNEEISIELVDGAKLRFIARSTGSGRGFSAHRLICDEAMILTPESLSALLFTLAVAPNPQTWYVGSAGFETSALLARMRDRGAAGTDPGLAYFEWSAVDDAELDDEAAYAAANPALGRRLRLETVRTERASLPEVQFARERLGIWAPTGGETVIDATAWAALADRTSVLTEPAVLSIDVNPDRTVATVGGASARADGTVHVEAVENRAGTGWVVDRVAGICAQRTVTAVVVDSAGPAAALRQALQAREVPVVEIGAREYSQACGAFYDAVQDGSLRHRGQQNLESAVDAARKRALGDSWAWHRRNARSDITPLVAVTLAHHVAHRVEAPRGLTRVRGRVRSY